MISAINSIGLGGVSRQSTNVKSQNGVSKNENSFQFSKLASNAIKSNGLNLARTIKFTGVLHGAFSDINLSMQTCKTKDSKGENVGSRANVNKLLHDFAGEFSMVNDAIKTTIHVGDKKEGNTSIPIYSRAQIKLLDINDKKDKQVLRFEMGVRKPSADITGEEVKNIGYSQLIKFDMTPINYRGEGTHEQAYVLNTKGNLMAVVEDGDNLLLTNSGSFSKKDDSEGSLKIDAMTQGSRFTPFEVQDVKVEKIDPKPSIGSGTQIVIGLENHRFVDETKASVKEFVDKVNSGEIVLPQFVEAKNAKDVQLIMLAGGFGSRAEYTNASSGAIFHDEPNGAQSTKGVFRTATGLTPMETTFITLHKAGLLDCSKGNLGIDKNIKFYLNRGKNRGNGEFSADLWNTMNEEKYNSALIFPNDSMSRMTESIKKANDLINSGDAAIAMIAKKVPYQKCIKNFGIIKYDPKTYEIEGFKEKPDTVPQEYMDKDGMCITNTFQFGVSKEAFKVLNMFENYFKDAEKESRDWSKQYIPILKALIDNPIDTISDIENIKQLLAKTLGNKPEDLPDKLIVEAKEILGSQKLYVIPTEEPWADCGSLNALYDTTVEIAKGNFKLEDFEMARAISCVNPKTGLIASSPEQKAEIEKKYDIQGKVMSVNKAIKVNKKDVEDIHVTYHDDPKEPEETTEK